MIQDIGPKEYNNAFMHKPEADEKSMYLCYDGRQILVKNWDNDEVETGYPDLATFQKLDNELAKGIEDATFLFTIDDTKYFLYPKEKIESLKEAGLEDCQWIDREQFRVMQPKHQSFAGVTGLQLHNWYDSHRFCGRCGHPMEKSEKERMLFCPECHLMEYPKICPAVIIGVIDGDRILVTKYAGREYKRYALIAGFCEVGETVEQTIAREVMEEVGLKIKNIRYYKSQPWSFSDTLLMGFFCDLDGEDKISIDEEELSVGRWIHRDDMLEPEKYDDISLTNEMMKIFKEDKVPKVQ